jgi:hypothetical protein
VVKRTWVYHTSVGDTLFEQVISGGECFAEMQEKLHHYNISAVLSAGEKLQLTEKMYDEIMYELAEAYMQWYDFINTD